MFLRAVKRMRYASNVISPSISNHVFLTQMLVSINSSKIAKHQFTIILTVTSSALLPGVGQKGSTKKKKRQCVRSYDLVRI